MLPNTPDRIAEYGPECFVRSCPCLMKTQRGTLSSFASFDLESSLHVLVEMCSEDGAVGYRTRFGLVLVVQWHEHGVCEGLFEEAIV